MGNTLEGGVEVWLDPGEHGERLSILDAPSYLLLRLYSRLSRRFNADYIAQLGVSSPVVRVLTGVRLFSPASFKEVVESTTMDKAQVSRVMAGMLKDGYIALSGPGENPTRFTARTRATLTAAGEALYVRAKALANGHQMDLLAALSPEQRRNLYEVMHSLLDHTQSWDTDDGRGED